MSVTIHFPNVGDGDCTIVDFEDNNRIAWIDINNSKALPDEELASLTGKSLLEVKLLKSLGYPIEGASRYESLLVDPVDYWKNHFYGKTIFRFILTHPDMDHLSGLYRLAEQEEISVVNFWDIAHSKQLTESDFEGTKYDYRDWRTYKKFTTGEFGNKYLQLHRLDEGQYWTEDGITILSPTESLEKTARDKDDYNISSYVLLVRHGFSVILLGGDADSEYAWPDIYESFQDLLGSVTLLKASHHGRRSGYYQPAVKAMSPKFTIVSVGKKSDTDASDLYAQYSKVYSTRFHGTIVAKCWRNGNIWLYDSSGNRIDND